MKNVKKQMIFWITLCLILSIGISSYADAPIEVRNAALQDLGAFKSTLANQKEQYGLNVNDDVENATTLGEGYEFFRISPTALDAMESQKKIPNLDELLVPTGEYIFPIKVGNKSAGIAFVGLRDGKWIIYQISSYLEFDQDVKDAKKFIKGNFANQADNNVKLVYDPSFGLSALAVKTGNSEHIIPIKKHKFLELNKNENKNVGDVSAKLLKLKNERKGSQVTTGGGGAGTAPTMLNRNVLGVSVLGIVLIVGIVAVVLKKR